MTDRVTIFEVGPRDGLQNEFRIIPTKDKIALVDMLSDCGLSRIEVTSFVSQRWVPQMADASDVMRGIKRKDGVVYAALTPNIHGYNNAIKADVREVAVFGSASEGFSQKNINCSIKDSLDRFAPLLLLAKRDNVKVRGYVSCVVDCPYDGPTPPEKVLEVSMQLLEMGCYEVSLGDTIGSGTPEKVDRLLGLILNYIGASKLAGHFHDTKGMALENIQVSLNHGLRVFDSAVGGLGGCPYATGAKGNVDTVSVARMLAKLGYDTGVDIDKLVEAATFAKSLRGG